MGRRRIHELHLRFVKAKPGLLHTAFDQRARARIDAGRGPVRCKLDGWSGRSGHEMRTPRANPVHTESAGKPVTENGDVRFGLPHRP